MEKKAFIFHWMIFGVFAAIAIFYILTIDPAQNNNIPGGWHTGFIWTFQDAQVNQLESDTQIRDIAYQVRGNLPNNLPEDFGCGIVNEVPLLNEGARPCNVFLQNIFLDSFKEALGDEASKYEIKLSGNDVIGIARESKTLIHGTGSAVPQAEESGTVIDEIVSIVPEFTALVPAFERKYEYNPSFRINLGTRLDEFQIIWIEASPLLGECRGNTNLRTCIENYDLPENWLAFNDCLNEVEALENKVSFCAIANGNNYNFALDFN